MRRRTYLALAGTAATGSLAGCTDTAGPDTDAGTGGSGDTTGEDGDDTTGGDGDSGGSDDTTSVAVERVTDLSSPWALTSVPDDDRLLVTERVGQLRLVDPASGDVQTVPGTPEVFARGQGGLLDVELHPRFPEEPWLYLTYSARREDGKSTTHVGRGRFDPTADSPRLREFEVLHAAQPFVNSTGHFGSRMAFDTDERLYVTVGDRQFKDFGPEHVAQDLTNDLGTVLRFEPDGSIPDDNPFVDDPEARDPIFSYGHRNAQGLTRHPETGDIWEAEFGEQDGDEINVLEAGGNYGWPIADEGCTYGSGDPIGVSHSDREDVIAPVFGWPCGSGGFPPSGMTFYTGEAVPEWQGDLLLGGLASQYLARFIVEGRDVQEAEPLLADRGWRIRDVLEVPESGELFVLVDGGNAPLVRLWSR
jgi:quinoprotein glucose dehydrogenase